ncbi:MAG: hypothetical protein U9R79_04575 [Armatimonadota bacterium]|nr:hypothetical protein [Armatimonadota bacterium]
MMSSACRRMVVAAVSLIAAATVLADEDAAEHKIQISDIDVRHGEWEKVPLEGDKAIRVAEDDTQRTITVSLRRTQAQVGATLSRGGEATRRHTELALYELVATEEGSDYQWAVFTCKPYEVNLFSLGPDRNYLVWLFATHLVITEVSKARTPEAAFAERYRRRGWPHVAAVYLTEALPPALWGLDAVRILADVKGLEVDEQGRMTVSLSVPDAEQDVRLVSADGKAWRLQ